MELIGLLFQLFFHPKLEVCVLAVHCKCWQALLVSISQYLTTYVVQSGDKNQSAGWSSCNLFDKIISLENSRHLSMPVDVTGLIRFHVGCILPKPSHSTPIVSFLLPKDLCGTM